MKTDSQLPDEYATDGDQGAFAEVVRRHVDFVYSAALRQVNGDSHLAEDVTQNVFADLARKAAGAARHEVLAGWLYTSARYAARNLIRSNRRREDREEAFTMQQLSDTSAGDAAWQEIRPVIDESMAELSERDRESLLLRFFAGQSFAEVATRLRITDNGARMRVERALDRLREQLIRRGITSTSAALGTLLTTHGVTAAPASLASAIAVAAPAAAVSAAAIASIPAAHIAVLGLVAAAGSGTLYVQGLWCDRLERELAQWRTPTSQVSAPSPGASSGKYEREIDSLSEELERLAALHAKLAPRHGAVNTPVEPTAEDRLPRAIATDLPAYPESLKGSGISGQVELEYVTDANGVVVSIQVTKSNHRAFERPTLQAVSKWKYEPGFKAGRNVNTRFLATVRITPDGAAILPSPPSDRAIDAASLGDKPRQPADGWF